MTSHNKLISVALFLFSCLVLFPAIVVGQSGRTPPQPTPSSLPQTRPKPPAESRLVIHQDAPKYKLVFGAGEFSDFVTQLNQHGEQGYKLKSITTGWQESDRKNYFPRPVAILQLDEIKYEYSWFETKSYWFWGIGSFEPKYGEVARQGFRLVEHFYSGGSCEPGDCELREIFVLERAKGVVAPREFRVAGIAPQRRMKIDPSAELSEGATAGFYPTSLISKFQVLLEGVAEEDRPAEKPDVQWTNLESRMKKLALEGYRLAFIYDEGIVIYRYPSANEPVRYVFLRTKPGKLEKALKALEQSGAAYRTVDRDPGGDRLIFEQPMSNSHPRSFRVLRFQFQILGDSSGKQARINLTADDEGALRMMNELVEQGYVVRTVFGHDHVGVLLER